MNDKYFECSKQDGMYIIKNIRPDIIPIRDRIVADNEEEGIAIMNQLNDLYTKSQTAYESISVGDTFTRIDKNGKTWVATVTKRTPQFVYVNKVRPYKVKVMDEFPGCYTLQDAKDTIERAEIKFDEKKLWFNVLSRNIFTNEDMIVRRDINVRSGKVGIFLYDDYARKAWDKWFVLQERD